MNQWTGQQVQNTFERVRDRLAYTKDPLSPTTEEDKMMEWNQVPSEYKRAYESFATIVNKKMRRGVEPCHIECVFKVFWRTRVAQGLCNSYNDPWYDANPQSVPRVAFEMLIKEMFDLDEVEFRGPDEVSRHDHRLN